MTLIDIATTRKNYVGVELEKSFEEIKRIDVMRWLNSEVTSEEFEYDDEELISWCDTGKSVKLIIVLQSHLSDALCEMTMINPDKEMSKQRRNRVRFVKYLLNKYSNTETPIDADAEYAKFLESFL